MRCQPVLLFCRSARMIICVLLFLRVCVCVCVQWLYVFTFTEERNENNNNSELIFFFLLCRLWRSILCWSCSQQMKGDTNICLHLPRPFFFFEHYFPLEGVFFSLTASLPFFTFFFCYSMETSPCTSLFLNEKKKNKKKKNAGHCGSVENYLLFSFARFSPTCEVKSSQINTLTFKKEKESCIIYIYIYIAGDSYFSFPFLPSNVCCSRFWAFLPNSSESIHVVLSFFFFLAESVISGLFFFQLSAACPTRSHRRPLLCGTASGRT